MHEMNKRLASVGVKIAHIILPAKDVDLEKWAVIACDQFTQDAGYWGAAEATARGAPSALNLIYPEIYLGRNDKNERVERIHKTMRSYIETMYTGNAVLNPPRQAGVFVERMTRHGVRRGALIAVDLEQYDWRAGSQSMIRATEGTLPERLPPRMDIRRGAALELPHIMLLVDDRENILMTLLEKLLANAPTAYDTRLMLDGGSVRGRLMYRKNDWDLISDVLEHLARLSINRYKIENPFLFAVGDGNHSLAAAKAVWDEFKLAHAGENGIENHAARYALAETVNLYDPAVVFEPIHRVAFNADADRLVKALGALDGFSVSDVDGRERLQRMVSDAGAEESRCGIVSGKRFALVKYSGGGIATADIDPLLEGLEIDFIHGEEELFRVATENRSASGALLPPFNKNTLFETIARTGPLPRKSFSIGDAREKRYYLECRRLFC
ncbi:MAG: DUF1015 domain-containing protein [Spirochaetaceae bacterium]|jgi:hypothetical protein|nr:DUF1015 domain-containing protein [Spirochaetaceae bacterium]